jgi:hypothetical protein
VKIFVSYARRDRQVVDGLLHDVRRARHEVWVDEELTGGQAWWDTILGTIRGADLFVVALSPDWLNSKACAAELNYAVGCNRTILPIMVRRVSPQMAPPVVANAQILDYLERTPDAAINLMTALSLVGPAHPLPHPLPQAPDVPMSYMSTYRQRLDEMNMTLQQQSLLLSELRAHLSDDDDRDSAAELIRRLRRRGDITESIGKEIDTLLQSLPMQTTPLAEPKSTSTPTPRTGSPTSSPVAAPAAAAMPAGWHPDPYRRFEQRYWDGAVWTEHVATQGRSQVDPPTAINQIVSSPNRAAPPPVAASTSAETPWDSTTFVLLILASVFCAGIVGVIVGAINLKKPARQSQARTLLIVGVVSMVIGFILISAANSGSNSGL